jgi:hypothetical protein
MLGQTGSRSMWLNDGRSPRLPRTVLLTLGLAVDGLGLVRDRASVEKNLPAQRELTDDPYVKRVMKKFHLDGPLTVRASQRLKEGRKELRSREYWQQEEPMQQLEDPKHNNRSSWPLPPEFEVRGWRPVTN